MSGILTSKQSQNVTDLMRGQIIDGHLYFFIAKATPWTDEHLPDAPADTVEGTSLQIWRDIIALKKVTNVSYGIKKYTWTSGTVYTPYSSTSSYQTSTFYTFTSDFNVYLCISNNGGAASTVMPTGRLSTTIATADGYLWKYMYTVSASDSNKFLTQTYIPVNYLTSDDGSGQFPVQQAAANCSIDSYKITTAGTDYITTTGSAAAGNTNTITLAANASSTSGLYVNSSVYLNSGTGAGQLRKIIGYNGVNKKAMLSSNWTTLPDNTSVYTISPTVNIIGDGSGATAYSKVVAGKITQVTPITIGANYSFADVTFSANTGSNATAEAQIAPLGGHGANAVVELAGSNLIVQVTLVGSESNTILANTTYRQVGLVLNPTYANTALISGTTFDMTTTLNLTNVSGTFVQEYVVGGTSLAKGYLVTQKSSNTFVLTSVKGNFATAETITGQTSSATATINTITSPVVIRSGDILYLENRAEITRSDAQEEDFRLILEF